MSSYSTDDNNLLKSKKVRELSCFYYCQTEIKSNITYLLKSESATPSTYNSESLGLL